MMADLIVNAEVAKSKPGNTALAPSGWPLVWHGRKVAVNLTEDRDVSCRRVYGYIGEIECAPNDSQRDFL